MKKPCSEIIPKKRHLCWTPPEGWGMSHEEMCKVCQERYAEFLARHSPGGKKGE